jgi:hypothetical protein
MVHRACLRPFEQESSGHVRWQRADLLSFPVHLAAGLNPGWSNRGEEDTGFGGHASARENAPVHA